MASPDPNMNANDLSPVVGAAGEEEKVPWLRRQLTWWRAFLKRPTTWPMFILSIQALFLNADQNLISPNLTQIAVEFNFTKDERDYYLGGQLSLGFALVGGFAAVLVGYLADRVNRRNMFALVVLIGETSCFCTLFVTDYTGLFISRAITGVSIGGANPLIMSMIGDMFDDQSRGKAISFITIMLSMGIALGQTVAGIIGPADALGWRAPFAIIAAPTFIIAPIFVLTTKDPPRGTKEKHVKAAIDGGIQAPEEAYSEKMDLAKLKILLKNKTALLAFIQGIPGSLPWGVMLVFFQDFLVQDIGPLVPGGISVQESTAVVLTFGVGSGIGIVLGGIFADKLWKKDARYVPLLMAVTTFFGAFPIYGLINGPPLTLGLYCIVTLPSGILISITGTAIRTVLMNVTLPETRGTAFAFHTLFDDIGRGLGPLWVSLLIVGTGGRVPGFNYSLGGWFICAIILLVMCLTVVGDLRKLNEATKAAMDRRNNNAGGLVIVDDEDPSLGKGKLDAVVVDSKDSDVATSDGSAPSSRSLDAAKATPVVFAAYASDRPESSRGERYESAKEGGQESARVVAASIDSASPGDAVKVDVDVNPSN